ncbi:MAG: hypothetical protein OEU91_06010, partial [Gammaproteobacteria bacterium]|nr:hypothetical protein [Gammaproteobacteria bacterium]
MKNQPARLGRLLAITLIAFTANPANAYDWPAIYNPLQMITLNLDMDPADWDTVKADTTNDIEVPALFWADGDVDEPDPVLVSVRR